MAPALPRLNASDITQGTGDWINIPPAVRSTIHALVQFTEFHTQQQTPAAITEAVQQSTARARKEMEALAQRVARVEADMADNAEVVKIALDAKCDKKVLAPEVRRTQEAVEECAARAAAANEELWEELGGLQKELRALKAARNDGLGDLDERLHEIASQVASKASAAEVTARLAGKVDSDTLRSELALFVAQGDLRAALESKADLALVRQELDRRPVTPPVSAVPASLQSDLAELRAQADSAQQQLQAVHQRLAGLQQQQQQLSRKAVDDAVTRSELEQVASDMAVDVARLGEQIQARPTVADAASRAASLQQEVAQIRRECSDAAEHLETDLRQAIGVLQGDLVAIKRQVPDAGQMQRDLDLISHRADGLATLAQLDEVAQAVQAVEVAVARKADASKVQRLARDKVDASLLDETRAALGALTETLRAMDQDARQFVTRTECVEITETKLERSSLEWKGAAERLSGEVRSLHDLVDYIKTQQGETERRQHDDQANERQVRAQLETKADAGAVRDLDAQVQALHRALQSYATAEDVAAQAREVREARDQSSSLRDALQRAQDSTQDALRRLEDAMTSKEAQMSALHGTVALINENMGRIERSGSSQERSLDQFLRREELAAAPFAKRAELADLERELQRLACQTRDNGELLDMVSQIAAKPDRVEVKRWIEQAATRSRTRAPDPDDSFASDLDMSILGGGGALGTAGPGGSARPSIRERAQAVRLLSGRQTTMSR